MLVRKIGLPWQPELAMGAVVDGADSVVVRNEEVIAMAGVGEAEFRAACAAELAEIERCHADYLGGRARTGLAGRVVIVIDDGIATGATVRAALRAVCKRGPETLVLAVPVAAADAIASLRTEADEIICLESSRRLTAVGAFYADFGETTDAEVLAALRALPATADTDARSTC